MSWNLVFYGFESQKDREEKEMGSNVSGWSACVNNANGMIVASCTVTGEAISGVGLIVNTGEGTAIASCYTELAGGSTSASPSLNLAPDKLSEGDTVLLAATGEDDGQHFFFEEKVTIGSC
ncbi:MAG TPA: hypothetical protein VGO43_01520 [Pyrinomonadaceae bacterium]|nr:hypothetical protein [Pyrinomonadaceae bacterium]